MAWPTELYEQEGHTYADYLERQREQHGTESGEEIAGEAWGEGVAEVTLQSREGTSYWTRLICAPGTPVTLEDSQGATLESDTCETGMGGDGEELTFRATTPDGKPIRLVVLEATDMESPAP